MTARPGGNRPFAIAVATALVIFAADLATPRGYALGVLYLATLAALLPSRVGWHPIAQATLCSALVLADVVLGAGGATVELTLTNRALSLSAIWLFAALLVRQQRLALERERANGLFRRALDAAPDAMLLVTSAGEIRYANAASLVMFGFEREELRGRPWHELVPERATLAAAPRVCTGHRKNGDKFPVECTTSVLDGDDEVQILAIRDTSEKQRYEERLRATQRMEAIGKLAGGIAHDFNNVLAAVVSYARFAKDALPADSPVGDDLDEVLQATDRASSLTRQLLAFSRRQVIEPIRIDLNELIRQTQRMLDRLLGEDIAIKSSLDASLWPVEVDPSQLEQVLLNLAVNSRDAMPKGGSLTLETANIRLDEAYARHHPEVEPGDYVLLAASDTGIGMSEEVRVRIFEPFFSTKPVGQGTGLGLATVYGIVKQSKGHIWVYSEPGQGTTFKIYLPRATGDAQTLPQKKPSQRPAGGSERVLVVEDEAPVRRVIVRCLRNAGYTVLEAANGADALRKLASFDGQIELLVTDVVMPQVGGRELAAKAAERYPTLRVLYLSGYTENAIVHHGVLDAGLVFLQKPFSPDDLLRRVRDVLDAPAGE